MRFPPFRFVLPALLLSTTPLVAQERNLWEPYDGPRRLDISVGGGLYYSTNWSQLLVLETFGGNVDPSRQVLLREMALAPGAGADVGVTYWKGKLGFRVQAGFMRSCLTTASRCDEASTGDADGFSTAEIDTDTWFYGAQGIVGLVEHDQNHWLRPYFLIGGGGVTYDLAAPLSTVVPGPVTGGARVTGNGQTLLFVDDPTTLLISSGEVGLETRFAVSLGVGTDIHVPIGAGGFGLRFEIADHMTSSPLDLRISRLDDGRRFGGGPIEQVALDSRAIHNLRATAGFVIEFGAGQPAAAGNR